ncbi:MAG TPA: hypothetical protein VG498_02865, partial [Terriglobales bacterium]|nr:hypothetical protein [Terriglobales bacterium]
MMKLTLAIRIWIVLLLLTLGLSKSSLAQLVLYDNFNSKRIDPAKWTGWQFFDPDIREATRRLAGEEGERHLRLSCTAYSATSDDFGGSGGGYGLAFPVPSAVNEVSFTAVVNRAEAVGCASNPSLITTDVEFRGNFFNVQSSPTSQIGDVLAAITIARYPTDVGGALTVAAFYSRCDDQFCGTQTNLDYRVLGLVQPGAVSKLRIKWDQPNHRFIFQLNGAAEVVSTYNVSDT